MEYLDRRTITSFQSEVQSQLGEAIEFATAYQTNRGESDPLELRQAAQDALSELMPVIVDATVDAYARTLKEVDYEAVELLFRQLAIRARLHWLNQDGAKGDPPNVTVTTRKGVTEGRLRKLIKRDGQ